MLLLLLLFLFFLLTLAGEFGGVECLALRAEQPSSLELSEFGRRFAEFGEEASGAASGRKLNGSREPSEPASERMAGPNL